MYPLWIFPREAHDQISGCLQRIRDEHDPDAWQCDQAYSGDIFARCEMVGIPLNLVAFGGDAHDKTQYGNRVTEMYFNFNNWLKAGGVLPDDYELKSELTAVTYKMKTIGKHDVRMRDPKKDIHQRIDRSPDRADACVLTVADKVMPKGSDKRVRREVETSDGGYHPHKKLRKSVDIKRRAR
jgi:hypothetical protein